MVFVCVERWGRRIVSSQVTEGNTFPCLAGFYRDHQWPLDGEDNGKVRDIRGGVDGTLKNGAHIVFDEYLGKVMSLNASQAWILMGDFKGMVKLSNCSYFSHVKSASIKSFERRATYNLLSFFPSSPY